MVTGFLKKFEHGVIVTLIFMMIVDLKAYEGLAILGIAVRIISIAVAYYFLKRSTGQRRKSTAQGWDGALPDMTRHHYCPEPHIPLWMRRLEMSALLKGWRGGHV